MDTATRITRIDEARRMPSNVIPFERREERRTIPRWIEWTREHQQASVKDLTGYIGGDDAA